MGNKQISNDYKIIKKLKEREFEDDYLLEKNKKYYILKKIKSKLSQKEIEEYNKIVNILKKLNNKYIIKYYNAFQEKDSYNILIEYNRNSNLKQYIQMHKYKNELIEEKIIKNIINQICTGLKEIYKNKLMHGNLRPDNIFLDKNNNIKIGYFDISKILIKDTILSKSKAENFQNFVHEDEKGAYNIKIDLYSLGCILFELLTLEEYSIDKYNNVYDKKIDTYVYNYKWNELIDLLLKKNYNEISNIEEIFSLVSSKLSEIKDKDINFNKIDNNIIINNYNSENIDDINHFFKKMIQESDLDIFHVDIEEITKIGEGKFGEVYLIEANNKKFALKKIKINGKNKEIDICKKIINILNDKKYIISFYDTLIYKDSFYILMEYVGDQNLKKLIQNYKDKGQLLEELLISDIIIQICFALKEIHKNNLIHGDLTLDNIYIDKNNNIKIGIAGIYEILDTNITENIIGKYKYITSKNEKEKKDNNNKDIYALGCLIYELFTLNEYKIDEKIDDLYNSKWQELIDSLLINDYLERPNIEEVFNLVKEIKNEIKLMVKVNEEDVNKTIYFFGNEEYDYYNEIDESNMELYINDKKINFERFFIPNKIGKYSIRIKLYSSIINCSYMFYN